MPEIPNTFHNPAVQVYSFHARNNISSYIVTYPGSSSSTKLLWGKFSILICPFRYNVNVFKEIKKFRGTTRTVSSVIDGETGAKNIANKFANIYSDLYSKVEYGEKLDTLREEINNEIENVSVHASPKIIFMLRGSKCDENLANCTIVDNMQ